MMFIKFIKVKYSWGKHTLAGKIGKVTYTFELKLWSSYIQF